MQTAKPKTAREWAEAVQRREENLAALHCLMAQEVHPAYFSQLPPAPKELEWHAWVAGIHAS